MKSQRLLWLLLLLPLASCDCSDQENANWTFFEPYPDVEIPIDIDAGYFNDVDEHQDIFEEFDIDIDFDAEPEVPDAWVPPDVERDTDWNEGEWTTEVVDTNFSLTHALNDRTSLVVDDDGTMWLGYHSC